MSHTEIPWEADGKYIREKDTGKAIAVLRKEEDVQFACRCVSYHDRLLQVLKEAEKEQTGWRDHVRTLLVEIRLVG